VRATNSYFPHTPRPLVPVDKRGTFREPCDRWLEISEIFVRSEDHKNMTPARERKRNCGYVR
jgi:hypothetical protein